MSSERFAPWLAIARRYFEHRAACAACLRPGPPSCTVAKAISLEATEVLTGILRSSPPADARPAPDNETRRSRLRRAARRTDRPVVHSASRETAR